MPTYELTLRFTLQEPIEPRQISSIELAGALHDVLRRNHVSGPCDVHGVTLLPYGYPTEAECARFYQEAAVAFRAERGNN